MIWPEIPSHPPGIIHLTTLPPTSHRSPYTFRFQIQPNWLWSSFLPRMLISTWSRYKNSSEPFKTLLNITYFNRSILTSWNRFRNSSIFPITPHRTLYCCDYCSWWCFFFFFKHRRTKLNDIFITTHPHSENLNWNVSYIGPELGVNPLRW